MLLCVLVVLMKYIFEENISIMTKWDMHAIFITSTNNNFIHLFMSYIFVYWSFKQLYIFTSKIPLYTCKDFYIKDVHFCLSWYITLLVYMHLEFWMQSVDNCFYVYITSTLNTNMAKIGDPIMKKGYGGLGSN